MTSPISNVALSNTFDYWRLRTNEAIGFINNLSNTTIGTLSVRANTVVANVISITSNSSFVLPKGTSVQRGSDTLGALRYNTTNQSFEGYTPVGWGSIGGGGLGKFKFITTTYTANSGDRLAVDTSSSSVTVNLPAAPDGNTIIEFIDKETSFANNNLIINRNGYTIEGQSANLAADTSSTNFFLQFSDSANTWQVFGVGSGETTLGGDLLGTTSNATIKPGSVGITQVDGNIVANTYLQTTLGSYASNTYLQTTLGSYTSNTYADTTFAKKTTGQQFTGGQYGRVTTLGSVSANTVSLNFANTNHFSVTLANNVIINLPSNANTGQGGSIFIIQDGTGSRTASFASGWKFPDGTAPTLTTTANATDRLDYVVEASNSIHAVLSTNLS